MAQEIQQEQMVAHPLAEELAAYYSQKSELEKDKFGQWVVFHKAELIGTEPSLEEAKALAEGKGIIWLDCLIREVGKAPAVFLSYGK